MLLPQVLSELHKSEGKKIRYTKRTQFGQCDIIRNNHVVKQSKNMYNFIEQRTDAALEERLSCRTARGKCQHQSRDKKLKVEQTNREETMAGQIRG